ncbi:MULTISPECIES: DoxX family protein [Halorubrum]|uniref:Thiosulfate dehydrogenase [quinone] large subunit n=1 Tax=Halorubrum sodomense TaxID=35743 RepID=A0A1I6GW25_HALSD|nr:MULTISPECIES: DoxX family membrane protein [Halorubrum]TKX54752.1 DoxX family membrane protein [Halorubrum sp. SP3]TKX69861.1 DoxX family membrane protein [Halorubrum sp. SP9]SFR46247.1 thiosulfate dehydrogenase [quinone] large subunit [Halorubrum sodomense]
MSTKNTNEFGGEFGGITLLGKAHSLSALFIVLLRATIGGMILFAGLGKVSEWPFDAAGYLANVDPASPVSGIYAAMASNAALMEFVNVFVPATQLLVGAALITGAFVRLAALGGTLQMTLFYLGGWSGDLLALFDSTLVYAVVFLTVAAFGAGRVLGLDAFIEQLEVGGQTLVERFPKLRYVLG